MRSKFGCLNLHTFSIGETKLTKLQISSERLSEILCGLTRLKCGPLGYNILIETNKEL